MPGAPPLPSTTQETGWNISFPAQTMLFSHSRSARAGRASSRNSGSAVGIPGPQHHGLMATGWPAGISLGLEGLLTWGAILGGPGRYTWSYVIVGIPSHPSWSSCTQRPYSHSCNLKKKKNSFQLQRDGLRQLGEIKMSNSQSLPHKL